MTFLTKWTRKQFFVIVELFHLHRALILAKSDIISKQIFCKNWTWEFILQHKFYAEFESFEKHEKSSHKQSYRAKTFAQGNQSKKLHF